jgi:hypothetical protein
MSFTGREGANDWFKKYQNKTHEEHLKDGAEYFNLAKGLPPKNLGLEEQHFAVPGKDENEGYVYKGYPQDYRNKKPISSLFKNDLERYTQKKVDLDQNKFSGKYSMNYDGHKFDVLEYGKPIFISGASSGIKGNKIDEANGPIPPGMYYVKPNEIWNRGLVSTVLDPRDWGNNRVRLYPFDPSLQGDRDNFFIHGGSDEGSAGCIDVGCNDNKLMQIIKDHPYPIPVNVTY